MNEKQIIEFCARHKITVTQYFILHLTKRRWEGYRQEFLDYHKLYPFTQEDIRDLLSKKMILTSSSEDDIHPETIRMAESFGEDTFVNTTMGEELWDAYPATFPLSGGGKFIARTGMDKQKFVTLYCDKIGRSQEKHDFVMRTLKTYIKLVMTGKINGHKITDWVQAEVWDVIASMEPESASTFKTDI